MNDSGRGSPAGATVASLLDLRDNSLNAVRLLLATTVIVSHAWTATGRSEPRLGGLAAGNWAVVGFFVLSGFLITRSRLTRPPRDYFLDRFLRIVPALVVALLVTAFVLAPLGAAFNDGFQTTPGGTTDTYPYDLRDAVRFFLGDLPLANPYTHQDGIGAMAYSGLAYPEWNAPLYTLFYEGLCYLGMGILVSLIPRRLLGPVLVGTAAVLTVVELAIDNSAAAFDAIVGPVSFLDHLVPFGLAFVWGAILYVYRDRVPLGPAIAAAGAVLAVLAGVIDQPEALAPLPFGLAILYLGGRLPLQRVGRRYDISYGMYIYGWPVHTMLLMVVPSLTLEAPLVVDIVLTLALATVFAFASCVVVEQPALRLKRPRVGATEPEAVPAR